MTIAKSILLGVNIDHIATLRQTRRAFYPDPATAVPIVEHAGADGITVHLREDRRHIQEHDIIAIQHIMTTRLNLEMAVTDTMLAYAEKIKPKFCCLVPEKREELTTEGGLDVLSQQSKIKEATACLQRAGIDVSLFIDPEIKQIEAALICKAPIIEIHTGAYADAKTKEEQQKELQRIVHAVEFAHQAGLIVNAGHGLHYANVHAIAAIPQIHELNIGHSIIAESIFMGLQEAVKKMKTLMLAARHASDTQYNRKSL